MTGRERTRLLAVLDPSGTLGLTDTSPGGGDVPLRVMVEGVPTPPDALYGQSWPARAEVLVLRTEDGTDDALGLGRAREVLARVVGFRFCSRCREAEGDCHCAHLGERPEWDIYIRLRGGDAARLRDESPEALARLLTEHTGCKVIRG